MSVKNKEHSLYAVNKMGAVIIHDRPAYELKVEFNGPYIDSYAFRDGDRNASNLTKAEAVVLSFWNRALGERQSIHYKTVERFQRHYEKQCRKLGLDPTLLPRLDQC